MKAAIVCDGVIGSGWATSLLLNGWDVTVFDPAAGAERRLRAVLDDARRSLPALYDCALPSEGALAWCPSMAATVAQADWIQESVPGRLPAKHRVLVEIQRHAPRHTPVASSTSGFTPSELQHGVRDPAQILVCHPFHPVYLLPLVAGGTVGGDGVCRTRPCHRPAAGDRHVTVAGPQGDRVP